MYEADNDGEGIHGRVEPPAGVHCRLGVSAQTAENCFPADQQ